MSEPILTIITPTTGQASLYKLINSMDSQFIDGKRVPFVHILLWDSKRDDDFLYPNPKTMKVKDPYSFNSDIRYSIVIPGSMVQGVACGSSLRAVGLMLATTPYVTFSDSDTWYDEDHLENLLEAVEGHQWAFCKRKIWANEKDYIGIDDFESVGDSPSRKVPYEMVDNNCMIFKSRLGWSGAVLYRTTQEYNDDRLFYAFLKQYGGNPGKTNKATINQICPQRLEPMFRQYCIKES